MVDILLPVAITILYFMIGWFVNLIVSGDPSDVDSWVLIFWPMAAALGIFMLVLIYIPCKLSGWFKGKGE